MDINPPPPKQEAVSVSPHPAAPVLSKFPQLHCQGCSMPMESNDKFCRHCGRRQIRPESWFYQPMWILFLALLVLGPFALMLVWKAPKMGKGTKALLATVILIYSALSAYSLYKIGTFQYQQLKELSNILQEIAIH